MACSRSPQPEGHRRRLACPDRVAVGDELKVEIEQMLDGIEIALGRQGTREGRAQPMCSSCSPTTSRSKRSSRHAPSGTAASDAVDATTTRRAGPRSRRQAGDAAAATTSGATAWSRRQARDATTSAMTSADGDEQPSRDRDDKRRRTVGPPKRPRFEAPPEVPQRPKPKRLRPGKTHRHEVLADLPEEQRPIAELALQGMTAVRTASRRRTPSSRPPTSRRCPSSGAQDGRGDAAQAARRRVARSGRGSPASDAASRPPRSPQRRRRQRRLDRRPRRVDPSSGRRTEGGPRHQAGRGDGPWLEDVEAALGVGRVIRALRLSSQPPKAGVMFPPQLARRLGEAATASLLPDDSGDRWSAVLEAAAFSPVRALVVPTAPPHHDHRRPEEDSAAPRPAAPAGGRAARRRGTAEGTPPEAASADQPQGREEEQDGQLDRARRPRRPR